MKLQKSQISQLIIILAVLTLLVFVALFFYNPGLPVGSMAHPFDTFDIDLKPASSSMLTRYGYGLIIFIDDPEAPKTIEYFKQFAKDYSSIVGNNCLAVVISRRGDDLLEQLRAKALTLQPYIFDSYQELAKHYKTKRRFLHRFINTTIIINKDHKIVFYRRGLVPTDEIIKKLKEIQNVTR